MIGDHLTEIYVTPPTGIRQVAQFGGPYIAAMIWDVIEKKVQRERMHLVILNIRRMFDAHTAAEFKHVDIEKQDLTALLARWGSQWTAPKRQPAAEPPELLPDTIIVPCGLVALRHAPDGHLIIEEPRRISPGCHTDFELVC